MILRTGCGPALLAGLMLLGAPATASARDVACTNDVGRQRAARYVRECLLVTPATHPPCNADNPCRLILSEVARGCHLLPVSDRPRFCAAY